jgi:ribosomal protein S18 acetylase RimI-like enzyme
VNVRAATEADLGTLRELWAAFQHELPEPDWVDLDHDEELGEIADTVRTEIALLAEEDGRALGYALARRRGSRLGRLTDLYVVPAARGGGVARALTREVVRLLREQGLDHVDLQVVASNAPARSMYARWGFRETLLELAAPLDALAARLAHEERAGASFGSIHVQTDDVTAVERAVRTFVPRLPGASRGSIVTQPRNGWIAVYDDVADRDPLQLRRLARELSDRLGSVVLALGVEQGEVARFILHERGGIVDEYLSVQEYYGPLPPGDVIALHANPRVVARLTGADPAAVRAAAVHADTPGKLPPPREILAGLAAAMGVEGSEHGWADAPDQPDAVVIPRA